MAAPREASAVADAHPFRDPVGEALTLPDGDALFDPVDEIGAGGKRLGPAEFLAGRPLAPGMAFDLP